MKKKEEEEKATASSNASTIDTVDIDREEGASAGTYLIREKPKPNTVPFKTGFVFEYGSGTEGGPVTITVTDAERIKVELPKESISDDRKKTIRSLVMLGLGKLERADMNSMIKEGRQSPQELRKELAMMGVNHSIPFGLGEESYYFDHFDNLRPYKQIDLKG